MNNDATNSGKFSPQVSPVSLPAMEVVYDDDDYWFCMDETVETVYDLEDLWRHE